MYIRLLGHIVADLKVRSFKENKLVSDWQNGVLDAGSRLASSSVVGLGRRMLMGVNLIHFNKI